MGNLEKIKEQIVELHKNGLLMLQDLRFISDDSMEKNKSKEQLSLIKKYAIRTYYQDWYTQSLIVIKQIIPDRLNEFTDLYLSDPKRKNVDILSYKIQDYLNGMSFKTDRYGQKIADENLIVERRLITQLDILKSSLTRYDSFIFDVKKMAQADLLDSEIEEAKELLKNKYYRAAGAILGVLLEKHLHEICIDHNISGLKKNACLSDYNEALKKENIIDVIAWRSIQRLADIRNLCDHKKEREPSPEDIVEMIIGTERIIKSIF